MEIPSIPIIVITVCCFGLFGLYLRSVNIENRRRIENLRELVLHHERLERARAEASVKPVGIDPEFSEL